MDMNRRGFLALIGATTALAALPKSLVVESTVAAEPMRISQGLYVKSRGIVHFLGNIESIAVETPHRWDFSSLRSSMRQYIREQNSNVTFDLVGELSDICNVRQLMYDILDSQSNFKGFNDYKMQVLAIMRYGHLGDKPDRLPAIQNNKLDYYAKSGDLLIAIDNTFMRDISGMEIPHPSKYADAPDLVARASTTFVVPSQGNFVSYYDENKMKLLEGDKPALEHFGA